MGPSLRWKSLKRPQADGDVERQNRSPQVSPDRECGKEELAFRTGYMAYGVQIYPTCYYRGHTFSHNVWTGNELETAGIERRDC